MNHLPSLLLPVRAGFPIFLAMLLAACGGGGSLDPILGTPVAGIAPVVATTSPTSGPPAVTGVGTNSRVFATFSKPMLASTVNSTSFTLACPAGVAVAATVTYDAPSRTAALTPVAPLPATTNCVATVTTAATDTTGLALASNFSWTFVTGAGPDALSPTVATVSPLDGSAGVCPNRAVSAIFSEAMDAATINATRLVAAAHELGHCLRVWQQHMSPQLWALVAATDETSPARHSLEKTASFEEAYADAYAFAYMQDAHPGQFASGRSTVAAVHEHIGTPGGHLSIGLMNGGTVGQAECGF